MGVTSNFLAQCSMVSRLAYEPPAEMEQVVRMLRYGLELSPDAFNRRLARHTECASASASSAAVAAVGAVRRVRNGRGLRALVFRRHSPGSAFAKDPTVFVAFKGTNSPADLLQDMKATWLRIHEALPYVHSGFATMLGDSLLEITRAVRSRVRDGDKLVVTGHSMGGALADMFSALVAMRPDWKLPPPVCVTFGEPRIWRGPAAVPRRFGFYRVVATGDAIVHVPTWLHHRRSRLLTPKPNVRSQLALDRFEDRPRLADYLANVNGTHAATKKSTGGNQPSFRHACVARTKLAMCHAVYMDVDYNVSWPLFSDN